MFLKYRMPKICEPIINLNANTAAFASDIKKIFDLPFSSAKHIEKSFQVIGGAMLGAACTVAAATASMVAQTADSGDGLIKTSGEGQTATALWRAVAACGRRGTSDGSLKTQTHAGMNEPDAKEWRGKINSWL